MRRECKDVDKNVVIEKLAFVITTHSLHSLFVCQKELCNDAISNMEKERKSLLEVTKAQREAILHDKGPMMVLAGPEALCKAQEKVRGCKKEKV